MNKYFAVLDDFPGRKSFALFLFIVSLAYLALGCLRNFNTYDEGISVYCASRILDGYVLYRDTWTIYPPGQFYLLALVFKLFGTSLVVERLLSIIIFSLVALCIYLLSTRLMPFKYSLFPWFFALMLLAHVPMMNGLAIVTALLCSLLSCLLLTRFLFTQNKWMLLPAGLLIGFTALFRQDIGFYTFVSASVVIICFAYVNLVRAHGAGLKKYTAGLSVFGILSAGVMTILVPAFIFLIIKKVDIKELVEDLIILPGIVLPEFRVLPYPPPCPNPLYVLDGTLSAAKFLKNTLESIPYYIPAASIVTVIQFFLLLRGKCAFTPKEWLLSLLFLITIGLFNYARGRPDIWHINPVAILASILLMYAFYSFTRNIFFAKNVLCRNLTICMVTAAVIYSAGVFFEITPRKFRSVHLVKLDIERASGIKVPQDDAKSLTEAVQYIQENTAANEKIFVCNMRHDKIYTNDVMFYFMVERHSATKYYEFNPGLTTTLKIQKQIVADIIKSRTKYVIMSLKGYQKELNKSNESSGVTLLDTFLKEKYAPVKVLSCYVILKEI